MAFVGRSGRRQLRLHIIMVVGRAKRYQALNNNTQQHSQGMAKTALATAKECSKNIDIFYANYTLLLSKITLHA